MPKVFGLQKSTIFESADLLTDYLVVDEQPDSRVRWRIPRRTLRPKGFGKWLAGSWRPARNWRQRTESVEIFLPSESVAT